MKLIRTCFFILLAPFCGYSQQQASTLQQLEKIITASESNFLDLMTGSPQVADTNFQYQSSISIIGTDPHSISISQNKKSATYIIPVSSTLNREETNSLYAAWTNSIVTVAGNKYKKECLPIEMGQLATGEQCTYRIKGKKHLTITISNTYSAETETSSLDVYIRKGK